MDYTKQYINNSVMIEDKKKTYCEPCEQKFFSLSSLTTYKKVVDISNKNRIYGLSAYAGAIRTASRFTSGHSAEVDSDS